MEYTKNKTIKDAYYYYNNFAYKTDINQCYKTMSSDKYNAWLYCKNLVRRYDGKNIKILGHNTYSFSVAFTGIIDDKEAFFYITKDYDRFIYLSDL